MLVLAAVLALSFVPAFLLSSAIYWLDRYEKEPLRPLLGVFVWGAVVASIGALVFEVLLESETGAILGSERMAADIGTSLYAPLVEETLKGLAVLLVFVRIPSEFDSVMDGLVYAGIAALGFAATENVLYLLSAADSDGFGGMLGLWFVRVVLDGWAHPFYTSFIGIGLALARLSRPGARRLMWPLGGFVLAVATHGAFNTLAGQNLLIALLVDWVGWILIAGVVVAALRREGKWIIKNLADEVSRGTITEKQYRTAASTWSQTRARLAALLSGRYRVTARFYQACAELAQKKEQIADVGDEGRNAAFVERLREELAQLAPMAQA